MFFTAAVLHRAAAQAVVLQLVCEGAGGKKAPEQVLFILILVF